MNIFNELIQGSFFSIKNRSIGSFVFDVVTAESHESNLRVTENPIESGAMIADHSILEPKSVSIEATMVGYEPPKNFQNLVSKYTGFNIDKFDIPIPAELGAMTQQAIGAANRLIGNVVNAEQNIHRVLAPWLPDYVPFTSDFSPTLDRVAQAYTELQSIQKSGEPITVKTGIRQYNDLVLTSIAVSQQDDNSAQFYISLREILIVETQTASGLKVDAPKATRSANQSAPVQNQGRTQPQVVSNSNTNTYSSAAYKELTCPLTQSQFDALVSFVYNVGIGNFTASTLLRKLNQRDYSGAAQEFLRWNRAKGRIITGLTNRRKEEKRLFES